ncbi:cellulase family glycosylhydrolase [Flammeovirgaceae bacterium SG7u.111]|nr:cellulase family glycosylhydrolase [Flammeovirgaceae bacterium SG7u.132]WPO33524.1 cellulase family glycosylhydrolase [Flammeovirgaceae bacterium SG7u.111]
MKRHLLLYFAFWSFNPPFFHLKSKISLLVFLLSLSFFNLSHAQFLHTNGKQIVDKNNEEIILRGIGLGGWMLQEGYMLKTSGPQHTIEARVEELIGKEKKEEFYNAWLKNHFQKIDVDSMASWGFNSIRLPMHYKLFTPPIEEEPIPGQVTWNEKGFAMVDSLLDWAEVNELYLILDLHAAPGGQGENADISDYDNTKPSLWESKVNQDKMVALWTKLAERYVNEPYIGAYDIINEPNWGFEDHASDPNGCSEKQNTLLWNLQKRVTEAIRKVDKNHMIIIEGNCWGNNYNGLPALWDDNLVISYHKYWNPNDVSAIQGMLDMRNQRNVPIWLGESGENSNAWFTDAIALLESNKIGWSWWPEKKMGYNNPLEIKINDGYKAIVAYWNGSGNKPSSEDAYTALMGMTENLKLENNIYHKDVVDAMIRQPHSSEALPFKSNKIASSEATVIYATDFDLGRHDVAYHDADYSNTSGSAGGLTWNKGYSYRNDGVDIEACSDQVSNGYNVAWTEDGEWLQYTLNVDSAGAYQVDLRYATQNSGSAIKILVENSDQSGEIELPATGGTQTWATAQIDDLILQKGKQQLKLFIVKGGFNINYFSFQFKKKALK